MVNPIILDNFFKIKSIYRYGEVPTLGETPKASKITPSISKVGVVSLLV